MHKITQCASQSDKTFEGKLEESRANELKMFKRKTEDLKTFKSKVEK